PCAATSAPFCRAPSNALRTLPIAPCMTRPAAFGSRRFWIIGWGREMPELVDGVTGLAKPAARSLQRYVVARSLAACLARRSSLRLMVSSQRSRTCPLQASSRDDHEPLCRNRRVIEMFERVCCGRERQDCSGGQDCERAGGVHCLVWFTRARGDADRTGGWAHLAMALRGDAGRWPG